MPTPTRTMPPKMPRTADKDCLQTMVSLAASSRGKRRLAAAPPSEVRAATPALTSRRAAPCSGVKPCDHHSAAEQTAVTGQPTSRLNQTLAPSSREAGIGSDLSSQKQRPSRLRETLVVETVPSNRQTVPTVTPYRSAPVRARPVSRASQVSIRSPCRQVNTVKAASKISPKAVLNR